MTTAIHWKLTDEKGQIFSQGNLDKKSYALANCQPAGNITIALGAIKAPGKFNLSYRYPTLHL